MSFWGSPPWDIGIDWEGIIRNKKVGMLAAVPFLDESYWLIRGSAALWADQWSLSRVCAKRLRSTAGLLCERGRTTRRNAVSWAASGNDVGYPLSILVGRERRWREPEPMPLAHPAAAQCLAWSGVWMALGACRIIDHVNRTGHSDSLTDTNCRTMVEQIEDELEEIAALPVALADTFPTADALRVLHDGAIERTCQFLCDAQADLYRCAQSLKAKERSVLAQEWYDRSRLHGNASTELYRSFALQYAAGDAKMLEALYASRGTESTGSSSINEEGTYTCAADVAEGAALVEGLVELLRGMRINRGPALTRTK